ncbi:Sm-like ribonucleoprotein [Lactarius deliciosus]|nr:Sm-like ribonucleoprotein [Lactarius deliciosus]
MSNRQQRVMVQPIRSKVVIWLYDNIEMRIEGRITAAEVYVKEAKPRRELGRILLKGDNITLIQQVV